MVISTGVAKAKISPLWAMLWFDDGTAAQARSTGVLGDKQLSTLLGAKSGMQCCFANSLCPLG